MFQTIKLEGNLAHSKKSMEFVVKAVSAGGGASEFRQSMAPHPLVHQELPHDPEFGVYNRRLRSLAYGKVAAEDLYWRLRRQVGLSHTGELATEIMGPDAEAMLNRVFAGDVSRMRPGRCSYQIACFDDGGMLMDGLLLRLAPHRFWYVQGDGEFPVWLRAQSRFSIPMSGSVRSRVHVQWTCSRKPPTKACRSASATST